MIGNEPGDTVSGNQIYNNIVTHSTGLPTEDIPGEAIHDIYGGRPGTGNVFHNNDSFTIPAAWDALPRSERGATRTPAPRSSTPCSTTTRCLTTAASTGAISAPRRI